ncbi:MAG: AMP-binding protein [Pseudomonadota bacterium]
MPDSLHRSNLSTILDRIADHSARDAGAPALTLVRGDQEERINRADFSRMVGRCAASIQRLGIRPGSVCILFFDHQPLCYAMFFGAMAVGVVPTFMPTRTSKQEPAAFWQAHDALFGLIDPTAIFASQEKLGELASALPDWNGRFHAFEDVGHDTEFDPVDLDSGSIALLQHSSGTTGLKKGVALSHRAVLAHTDAYAATIDLKGCDTIVSWLPVYHDMGLVACLLLPLLTGRPVVLIDRMEWLARPGKLFDAIERHRGTLSWMPNFAFAHLAALAGDLDQRDLSSMRLFINCSEPCRPQSTDRFVDAFADWGVARTAMATCYAMAETVFAVSQSKPGQIVPIMTGQAGQPDTLSSGPPLQGIDIQIRDAQENSLASGSVGEVWVRGSWLFDGYYKRPELTAERFSNGWYRTGDLACQAEDGSVYVLGRTDDLLIIDGRNIFAHEVEDALNGLEGLAPGRNLALGVADAEAGTAKLTILAEASHAPSQAPDIKKDIRRLIGQRFALNPSRILLLDRGQLHKTTSGKISRRQNLQAYLQGQFTVGNEPHVP